MHDLACIWNRKLKKIHRTVKMVDTVGARGKGIQVKECNIAVP